MVSEVCFVVALDRGSQLLNKNNASSLPLIWASKNNSACVVEVFVCCKELRVLFRFVLQGAVVPRGWVVFPSVVSGQT